MSAEQPAVETVRSFIARFRTEILAEWKRLARSIPVATDLPSVTLADHIPDLLDQVAAIAESLGDDATRPARVDTARRHAVDRLGAGFDVSAVVHELSILRGCMFTVWNREHRGHEGDELRALNIAFDRAIAESVARYLEARDRTLSAIDAISLVSLEAKSLDDLLQRLLAVFSRTTASVQTCAIMLREDDRLYTRAAVGLDADVATRYSQAKGEGFAGQVWAEVKPLELRSAYMDDRVKSPGIRERHVRALYGIPLVEAGEVIGIAHMGSLTASQFSDEDKQLFSSMCARATACIYQQMLRDELARALGKLEALIATAPVGIAFLDRDLKYLRINEALATMNGRPAADHIGRSVAEMLPPAAVAPIESLLRKVIATGEPLMNLDLRSETRVFLATYFPVRAGGAEVTAVGGVVTDVTDMRTAQEALVASEARLKSIIEHAPVAIYVKDEDGRVVLANERLAQTLGVPRAELIGHRGDELVDSEFEAGHRAHDLEVLRSGRPIEGEEELPGGDGTRTFLTAKFPIPGDRGKTYVCGISTDITDRKHMEERLRAAVRARDDVLAIVSHDLRNPLGAIQLSASMLHATSTDPRGRKHLDMIHRSSARMERLIGDLLDAAIIDRKGLQLEKRPRRADELVNEAADLNEPSAAEREIEIRRECETTDEIECDRERLLQVFGNLVGNAIKFCRPGDAIAIRCETERENVRFSVTDSGPGIPASALPHLFEPYWSSPEHARHGAGLGLYIARGIVEAHGGKIWADRRRDGGTTFAFTIPKPP